jgi:hypothetical protein
MARSTAKRDRFEFGAIPEPCRLGVVNIWYSGGNY